jgi:hypothetical protein
MKLKFALLFAILLAFASLGVYAQSSKLIGTWISLGYHSDDYNSRNPKIATIVVITKENISVYPVPNYARALYTWSDPANDGVSIYIKSEEYRAENIFTPYIVTDNNLFIGLPGTTYYLTRYSPKPASALLGKWIHPEESGDIEVTITDRQIVLKKGRITKALDYFADLGTGIANNYMKTGNEVPGVINFGEPRYGGDSGYARWKSVPYYFMDDNHVIICLETFDNGVGYEQEYKLFYLTRQ